MIENKNLICLLILLYQGAFMRRFQLDSKLRTYEKIEHYFDLLGGFRQAEDILCSNFQLLLNRKILPKNFNIFPLVSFFFIWNPKV